MARFVYLLLFIFAPGNALLNLRHDCGDTVLQEKSGSIQYSSHPNSPLLKDHTKHSKEKLWDVTCTWIINAYENQTVWIDVVSVGNGGRIGVKFGNGKTLTLESGERTLVSGSGRTIIEWSLRKTNKTFGTLHLRWNTSEDSHTPALVSYTHGTADPVSPSPSQSDDVTYAADIPASSNTAPKAHALRGENTEQGGGVSDLADKNRPLFPQEVTNNGQEAAGASISDLALTGTHSYSETHTSSGLDTHMDTLSVLSHEPSLAQSSTENQSVSVQTEISAKVSAPLSTTDAAHTELNKGNSQHTHVHAVTKTDSRRGNPSSSFPTSSFMTVSPPNHHAFDSTSKHKDFLSYTAINAKATTVTDRDVFTTAENSGTSRIHAASWSPNTVTDDSQPIASEMDRTDRSPRSTDPNQTMSDDSVLTRNTPVTVSKFPIVTQTSTLVVSEIDTTEFSGVSKSPSVESELPITVTNEDEPTTSNESMHTLTSSEASTTSVLQSTDTSTRETSSTSATISNSKNKISAYTAFPATLLPDMTSPEGSSTPEGDNLSPSGSDCLGLACTSYLPSTSQGEHKSHFTSPPSSSASPRISPNVTSDLMDDVTVRFENRTDLEEPDVSPSTNTKSNMHTDFPLYTPQYSHPSSEITQSSVGFSDLTETSRQTVDKSPTQTDVTSSPPLTDAHTGSTDGHMTIALTTSSSDTTAPYVSQVNSTDHSFQTITPHSTTALRWASSQTSVVHTASVTSLKMNPHGPSTETTSAQIPTHSPVPQPSTARPLQHTTTSSRIIQTRARTTSTQAVTQASWIHSTASGSDRKWPHGRHYFIVEDQPAVVKERAFQVLLQIILEGDYAPTMRLLEVETFLHRLSGFQNQYITWYRGPVLQTVVQFRTVESLSWLGRVESLLQEAGLNPLPKQGVFVGGVRVKNITVGGLQADVCEWLFDCPSGFQCISSRGNATCTSVCHSEYCKHQGICVHRLGQQPVCQCPVGEDFWFMGPRCDLHMTRPRLVGVCFGVLVAVATLMALLSYLAVRRFKRMLMQAKVEQTRSSYRRFNHFDELSARFWGRSWPGSEDSLDNPGFTRSDELLHLRALDRTCCHHDDTLSVVSTYHGSRTHLSTIYPHGSHYGWDLSNCSLADGVVDSGKASDLSICSWPIEPIQWTPFPLLQQLSRNTTTVKASRPRSYCEGMELVDLEKSWTA